MRMYGASPPRNHMGFGSPPSLGGSPKQYGGSLSVGDMGGWMGVGEMGGSTFEDTSGFYGDNVVIDDSMMMMGEAPCPSLSLDEPPPSAGRLSIDAMPAGMMGGLGSPPMVGVMPVALQAPPSEGGLPQPTSIRGSPLATSDTAISGSPLAKFAGENIKPVQITAPAAPPAATKPASRRKAKAENGEPGRVSKKPWNDEEDTRVRELVAIHGAKNWPLIADHLPGRVGKQCRER